MHGLLVHAPIYGKSAKYLLLRRLRRARNQLPAARNEFFQASVIIGITFACPSWLSHFPHSSLPQVPSNREKP